jgi:hypothetical protein
VIINSECNLALVFGHFAELSHFWDKAFLIQSINTISLMKVFSSLRMMQPCSSNNCWTEKGGSSKGLFCSYQHWNRGFAKSWDRCDKH